MGLFTRVETAALGKQMYLVGFADDLDPLVDRTESRQQQREIYRGARGQCGCRRIAKESMDTMVATGSAGGRLVVPQKLSPRVSADREQSRNPQRPNHR